MYFLTISKSKESDPKWRPLFGREFVTQRVTGPEVVALVGTDGTCSAAANKGDRLIVIDSLDPGLVNQMDVSNLEITTQNYPDLLGDHVFSLVFVDFSKRSVTLIRSTSAARVLYYSMTESNFYCASNLGLLKHLGCRFEPNLKALPEFYAYRMVLPPHTLVDNVFKLAAGEMVTWEYFDRASVKNHHFDFTFAPSAAYGNLDEASRQVETILSTDIATTLQRDPHPACLLSGGLDSSLLAAIARNQTDNLLSYSSDFSFLNKSDRESEYATSVAEHLGVKHTVCCTDEAGHLDGLVDSIAVAAEPLHHLQTVLLYILFHRCPVQSHRVFLCGEGADGFFGNTLHARLQRFEPIVRLLRAEGPFRVVPPLARFVSRFDPRFEFFSHSFANKMEHDDHILWTTGLFGDISFITQSLSCTRSEILRSRRELMARYPGRDIMDKVTILCLIGDMSTTMPLWAHLAESAGFAVVYPFTTPTLTNYVNSVPWAVKGKEAKIIVKSILEKLGIPGQFIDRPKLSFGLPARYWALPGALFQPLIDMAEEMFDRSILRSLQVEEIGKAMVLWNMINYYLWHRMFIENEPPEDLKREIRDRRQRTRQ